MSGLFSPLEWGVLTAAVILAIIVILAIGNTLAIRRNRHEEMVSRQIRQAREAGGGS